MSLHNQPPRFAPERRRARSISVVLPAYNEEALIEQTIRHVAAVLQRLVVKGLFGYTARDVDCAFNRGAPTRDCTRLRGAVSSALTSEHRLR